MVLAFFRTEYIVLAPPPRTKTPIGVCILNQLPEHPGGKAGLAWVGVFHGFPNFPVRSGPSGFKINELKIVAQNQ